jgi:hypothetical protein
MKTMKQQQQVKMNNRMKEVDKAFGIDKEANDRAIGCTYVIDTAKRTKLGEEPKMVS